MIEIARIASSAERFGERFYTRFFTESERVICGEQPARLAARFCAKEAVAKALGTGIGDIGWKDIEVLRDDRGRPILTLHGAAAKLSESLGLSQWEISLSHTDTAAIAFVVAV